MGRLRLISGLAVVAALTVLCLPAAALANSYTWGQPGDVTSTAQYGVQSWSYTQGASSTPLTFSSSFTGNGETLAGYTDSASSPTTWIAAASGGPLEMVPAEGQSVTLTWTSPLPSSVPVTLSGSIAEPNSSSTLLSSCGADWTLTSGGTTVASGSLAKGTTSATIQPTQVSGPLVLTVTDASSGILTSPYTTACVDTTVSLALSADATQATPSAVTVTSPTAGQTFTSGQPTFAGAAGDGFGYKPQVTVRVYLGSTPTGTPFQVLPTTEMAGAWSVPPSSALANGTYTVQAEQDDVVGDVYLSAPVTFTMNIVNNVPPTVTLNAPASEPLTTATPTFTGTGETSPGDSVVELEIYAGDSASGPTVARPEGPVNGSGNWSIQVPSPGLANGEYTAVAEQIGANNLLGTSQPVQFTINVSTPPPPPSSTVTLTQPAGGASIQQNAKLVFSGASGTASGDSSTITVTLYEGSTAGGTPVGTVTATASNGTWSATWPTQLALGLYTAQASQVDGQGDTDTSQAHTFLIVPSSSTIGVTVDLSRSRTLSVPISCTVASGACMGTVLVVTVKKYQPVRGGPIGPIKLMFSYVGISAGQTFVARGRVSGRVMRALRHKKGAIKVRVTTSLTETGAGVVKNTTTLTLRLH